ncbi:MAG: alpha-glucosidase/alpha-galactosidase [Chloroflexi bacterium]|nr:MAG: alpha-glucosidase/alpha-galactosidase [Chloroflexota bacterium]
MTKITLIGAGSAMFGKGFITDILTRPALAGATLSLMDINPDNLAIAEALAKKIADQVEAPARIEATTDRRRALDGADYVVCVIEAPGGIEANKIERRISEKYGVDQAIGCTTGPGGVFRTLRYMPPMLEICRDMEALCPDALLLHYANPTTMVPWALNIASSIKSIGMCHSVQHTAMTLARYLGVPYQETGHWVAGVNHQAWFLRFEWQGKDAYPLLLEKMAEPEIYQQDRVRWEMMRYFGYFLTESSYHNSEYVPYFRKNPTLIERFAPKVGGMQDHQSKYQRRGQELREAQRQEAFGAGPVELKTSDEYAVGIIHAMETNIPYRFNGNVINTGLITNLPPGCCVEAPCLVDNMGVHPCYVGDLPPQCAALNRSRIAGDELAVKAALELDRKAAEQAVALDPLTAAICTLDQIHDMVDELFTALVEYLPQFN